MNKAHILVVEDETIVAKDLGNRLRNLGYSVPAISLTGEDALKKAAQTHPDLVLMDIRLKGEMDGVETAVELRKRFDVPIIYLTAYSDDHTIQRAKPTQPSGYLLKPFVEKELETMIEMALYKHQMERKLRESEARKRAIVHSALDCIITLDHEGRILEFNPAAERAFGHSAQEACGRVMADLLIPASFREWHRRELAYFVATGQGPSIGRRVELTALRADGTEFPMEMAVTRIDLEGPPLFTCFLRDISRRKQHEEELDRYIRKLQAERSKVKTLSGLVPICSACKKIRDDHGYWNQLEFYLQKHSEAQFTHGYCPECADKMLESFRNEVSQEEPA